MLLIALTTGCTTVGGRPSGRPPTGPGSLPPEVDADRDGVPEDVDQCPGTVVPVAIDESGCTPFEGRLEGVDFAPGGTQLDGAARRALAPLVAALTGFPQVAIEVQGHTDNRGRAATNLELSKLRVMSVVRYLVAAGVAPERLRPFGYGENRPVASNATPEGRHRNRRIEVRALAAMKAS